MSKKKYVTAFKLVWLQSIEYRFSFIFDILCSFIPVIALLFLWGAIYGSNNSVEGYSIGNMFSYVILARFICSVITPGFFFDVTEEIQEGLLSNYIVKPINYIKYWFAKELASKSRYTIIGCIPLIILLIIYRKQISFNMDIVKMLLFLISFILAYILYFIIMMILCTFSFKYYDISSWYYTITFIIEFLSGAFIPLNMLPYTLKKVINILPFKYLVYYPTNILANYDSLGNVIGGIIIQVVWVLALSLILQFAWKVGRKKYDAYGG